MKPNLALSILLAAASASPALANESAYTPLDLDACTQRPTDPREELPWSIWDCIGYAGIPYVVSESDLRFSVGYGVDADSEIGFGQTLPPFNTIGETLEWRLDDAGVPFATVLRYFTEAGENRPAGQVLVVTRIESPVCHVAYVDALANPDANELARQAADLFARSFHCDFNTPVWIGAGGLSF